ncbi:MAG: 5-formyltetrahydrofolate cyclo-ligase [Eubacterium sp.]|nr:5-formyltetrahydrofolate cyclo-ligase [Eubacterium sp.]
MEHMTKEQYRKLIRERRGQAAPSDLVRDSEIIFRKIRETNAYLLTSSVYCYVDYNNEVQTRTFIAQAISDGKQVAVPRVEGDHISFYYIESLRQLVPGKMGILEPKKGTEGARSANALVIMPGVAFDTRCNRIGYGAGYYDKFLKAEPTHVTIAAAFDFQVFDEVPHDDLDIRPQWLFTESRRFHRP